MVEMWEILDEHGNKTGAVKPRGEKLEKGEFHLCVYVWVFNSQGEFLVSKRAADRATWPLFWETTGGSAKVGEDSLAAALAETREELGVELDPANGEVFRRLTRGDCISDVWLFRQDVDMADVKPCPVEVCDVAFMAQEQIKRMISEGEFIGYEFYPYLDELFEFVGAGKPSLADFK